MSSRAAVNVLDLGAQCPVRRRLETVYRRLRHARGHAQWWPAQTPFEVCVGAILTQNTAWTNVEKALASLREAGYLAFSSLNRLGAEEIAPLIRSSGCYNVKARRLRAFLDFLANDMGGQCERMARMKPLDLRRRLLEISGIGPETADSIALYAARQPLFVVDAYTHRLLSRLGLTRGSESYDDVQRLLMRHLPANVPLYNDFHAQIVLHGKDVCRTKPRCGGCVLSDLCAFGSGSVEGGIPRPRAPRRRQQRSGRGRT